MSLPPATPLPPPKECRRLREALSWSQSEVAAKLGVTRETVRSWETGRSKPRGRMRDKYARLLATMATEAHAETEADALDAVSPGGPEPAAAGHPDAAEAAVPRRQSRRALKRAAKSRKSAVPAAAAPADHAGADRSPVATATGTRPEPALPDGTLGAPARTGGQASGPAGPRPTPAEAFDSLYAHSAPGLVRQAYVLTGRRHLAQESVEQAFSQAWLRWPEVAVDRDPTGWVRAAAYEYAMSPWHRFRRRHRQPEAPPAHPDDRQLLDVLLGLPPVYRRTLVLYDGVGLDLPDTAAETEASTPATASRLLHARRSVAERLPQLSDPAALHAALTHLARGEKLQAGRPAQVRDRCERRTRFWTRTAIAFTALIIGATALTVRTAPTEYDPPQAPGVTVSGVPPRMGPGPMNIERKLLHIRLTTGLTAGPYRLQPLPG
ncbi:helix-turn-helix domain-containing protein [Streptomyces sp. NPDC002004]